MRRVNEMEKSTRKVRASGFIIAINAPATKKTKLYATQKNVPIKVSILVLFLFFFLLF